MITKSSFLVAALALLFGAVAARCQAIYNKIVPPGYEDERGFHAGAEPPID